MEYSSVRGNGILGPGRVPAIPDRVLDARLIACLIQPMGCAGLNDICAHDGTMGQMLPSTDSAIWRQSREFAWRPVALNGILKFALPGALVVMTCTQPLT
jgi:hypothetical protein